jgi:precorrin-3B methylase
MASGSLTVVGTGIRLSQISVEARACIESADKLLFLVSDPITSSWLMEVQPRAESLYHFYATNKPRSTTYREMVEHILSGVREGIDVCAAFYGHPGVFAYPSHEAIRRARLEGFRAKMLPGISAEDCLFADLGIDPGTSGCQSFEATDFLIRGRKFDTSVSLILWQIGVVGEVGFKRRCRRDGLRVLVDVLQQHYDPAQQVVIYEASLYPHCDPFVKRLNLARVPESEVTPMTTLYIPPKAPAVLDLAMVDRLGIPRSELQRPAQGSVLAIRRPIVSVLGDGQ